jgi:K+ transporter
MKIRVKAKGILSDQFYESCMDKRPHHFYSIHVFFSILSKNADLVFFFQMLENKKQKIQNQTVRVKTTHVCDQSAMFSAQQIYKTLFVYIIYF